MRRAPLFLTAATALIMSVLSAWLTDRFLSQRIPVLGDFAGFQLAYNPGVAFSVTFPPLVQHFLVGVALVAVTALALRHSRTALSSIAFGLIIGGALGNVIDRIPDGLVTDFIQVGSFPIFNVADSCITVGVGLLLLQMLLQRKQRVSSGEWRVES